VIPYARQDVDDEDVRAVVEVLRSDWLTQGPMVERFERAVADYCGSRFAVAANSGTSALHLAYRAAGLGPGDLLWTSPNTFVASANAARYCGADVDFVDIDPRTYNMSPQALERKLRQAKQAGRPPAVVVPVHFAGQPCQMDAIGDLARAYGFRVIEDASHALGATYGGSRVGACAYSSMVVLSFHPVKIITTGEGGMVLTQDGALAERIALLRSHGITRDPALMDGPSEGPWYYQQVDLGYNYRLTDIQAVLGLSQMRRADAFVARRRALAARYDRLLADLPVTLPWQHPASASAWHLYVVRLRLGELRKTRRAVVEALREAGIRANVHYIPVHTQPYYRALGFRPGDFPQAEAYYREAITLPMYAALTEAEQDRVADVLREVLT
jgi:UDP-4-amino-4,6-dideoxy-N-acetyl-beta-L-altrosamine transaminase